MFGANVKIKPPKRNIKAFMMMAVRLPRRFETPPARSAPKGPPTANADTATAHCAVVCPGNTTGSGAF